MVVGGGGFKGGSADTGGIKGGGPRCIYLLARWKWEGEGSREYIQWNFFFEFFLVFFGFFFFGGQARQRGSLSPSLHLVYRNPKSCQDLPIPCLFILPPPSSIFSPLLFWKSQVADYTPYI